MKTAWLVFINLVVATVLAILTNIIATDFTAFFSDSKPLLYGLSALVFVLWLGLSLYLTLKPSTSSVHQPSIRQTARNQGEINDSPIDAPAAAQLEQTADGGQIKNSGVTIR